MVTQDSTPSGLEVLSKSGHWVKAPPVPGAFVVNIADCFMRQTNDYFVSTVHRVVNRSGRERYSLPFFFGFDPRKVSDRPWGGVRGSKMLMLRRRGLRQCLRV